jgi:2-keto-4-pentenoate hydratase/2-oxohepta-3-ene-1,7-dioic acid hydratase in catechol pathway
MKDLSREQNTVGYILGYTAGNDVSPRYWQVAERSGGVPSYAKSFDKFAPIGPVLCSPEVIVGPTSLTLETKVNAEQRQWSGTDDMIFDIPAILRHLSRGTTLRAGTVVMTGTPGGVAASKKPPVWLKHGDIVEVGIEGIGQIRNSMLLR